MTEKTSAWTDEERAEMAKRRAHDYRDAWARDSKGHPIPVEPRWEGHICPEYEHCHLCVREAWDCAAAIAFGLMGMAHAIRDRNACPTCGANMLGEGGPCYDCVRYA